MQIQWQFYYREVEDLLVYSSVSTAAHDERRHETLQKNWKHEELSSYFP